MALAITGDYHLRYGFIYITFVQIESLLQEMFDLLHSLGGSLAIKNRQNLTPLTLAAKLARKEVMHQKTVLVDVLSMILVGEHFFCDKKTLYFI